MGVIRPRFGGRWVAGLGRCVVVPPGPEMDVGMSWSPCLIRSTAPGGRVRVQLGHEVVDDYLEFLAARCRPNTVLAAWFDLKVFFTLVPKDPDEVTTGDVLAFITAQRSAGDPKVYAMLSRDTDSRLSKRERLAVDAWLDQDCDPDWGWQELPCWLLLKGALTPDTVWDSQATEAFKALGIVLRARQDIKARQALQNVHPGVLKAFLDQQNRS